MNSVLQNHFIENNQMRSTKFYFDIFIEIMFVLLLYLLIENFKLESKLLQKKQ